MGSPSARSLAECRKRGWEAQVVERRVPKSFITLDLFGVIDIVALTPEGILGIQATSGTNHSSRIEKILGEPRAKKWLAAGGKLEVWSWAKRGARGKRKTWTLRTEAVRLDRLDRRVTNESIDRAFAAAPAVIQEVRASLSTGGVKLRGQGGR